MSIVNFFFRKCVNTEPKESFFVNDKQFGLLQTHHSSGTCACFHQGQLLRTRNDDFLLYLLKREIGIILLVYVVPWKMNFCENMYRCISRKWRFTDHLPAPSHPSHYSSYLIWLMQRYKPMKHENGYTKLYLMESTKRLTRKLTKINFKILLTRFLKSRSHPVIDWSILLQKSKVNPYTRFCIRNFEC